MIRPHLYRVTILLSGLFLSFSLARAQRSGSDANDPRSIMVSGEAEVRVVPDQAVVPLIIKTEALEVEDARRDNEKGLKDLYDLARRLGISEGQIQMDYLTISPQQQSSEDYMSLAPRYRKDEGGTKLLGYYVTRNVTIQVNDLSRLEELLAEAAKLNPVSLGTVQLRSSGMARYREQVRLEAIRDARAKAVMMAKELDAKIGKPISVSEFSSYEEYYNKGGSSSSTSGFFTAMMSEFNNDPPAKTPGRLTIGMRVTVFFELE